MQEGEERPLPCIQKFPAATSTLGLSPPGFARFITEAMKAVQDSTSPFRRLPTASALAVVSTIAARGSEIRLSHLPRESRFRRYTS